MAEPLYKFYKIFPNGHKKYVHGTESTLDPEYHGYINWCRENKMSWELIRTFDGKIMYHEEYNQDATGSNKYK